LPPPITPLLLFFAVLFHITPHAILPAILLRDDIIAIAIVFIIADFRLAFLSPLLITSPRIQYYCHYYIIAIFSLLLF